MQRRRQPERITNGVVVPRQTISERTKQEVLLSSKRRCPLCYRSGNTGPREGAVAHIEQGSQSGAIDNLVFLCLEHHHQLDNGSLTPAEVKEARAALYRAISADSVQYADERPWRAYEQHVVDLIRSSTSEQLGDNFGLRKGELCQGRSGVAHEVDVAV